MLGIGSKRLLPKGEKLVKGEKVLQSPRNYIQVGYEGNLTTGCTKNLREA